MQTINIQTYREIKLNSFKPLCRNEWGQRAVQNYNFPPFIDASCRREPDFENPNPSISALCRQGSFAPHLKLNDIVVYMTVQGRYEPYEQEHHRIVAILQVVDTYATHQEAQTGYAKLGLPLPSNCMVADNPPYKFDQTASRFKSSKQLKEFMNKPAQEQLVIGERHLQFWDSDYLRKSQQWTCFVRTQPIYVNVTDPIPIFRQDFEVIFGKLPNTRTPNKISAKQLRELGRLIGLDISFGQKGGC